MKLPSKIGIVSGIGPLAGSDVLAKIFKNAAELYGAVEDNEYPDLILLNHGIEGVDNSGVLNAQFETGIVQAVQQLEMQGANIIGIACNTAHLYMSKIKTQPETTLINLINVVSSAAKDPNYSYLLLTSNTSKQQRLYHGYLDKYAVHYAETSPDQQALLDATIGHVMAHKLNEAGELAQRVLDAAKVSGFDAVIAGCTELPIAIDNAPHKHGLKIIDSNHELAKALLRKYYN